MKGASFEASAKRKEAEVAAAAASRSGPAKPELAAADAWEAVSLVQAEVTSRMLRKASHATVLRVDDRTPFIIYAGSNAPEHRAEARKRGALGCTNGASELFEYVLQSLRTAA